MKNNRIIPLSVPNLSMDILDNVKETISSGWVSTGGRFISEFEENIAKYLKVDRAVSTQSGTAGLHLSLLALGVDEQTEVIVPTVTFIAAVNPVRYCGGTPIFMDADETMNMDLDKLERFLDESCYIENGKTYNKSTKKHVKGVVIVHVFGNPIDMVKVMKIKMKYNLFVLEDATEALGSIYQEGEYAGMFCGTIGDAGVFSFNANKIITTGGGGMIVSNDNSFLNKVSFLGVQAKTNSLYFVHDEVGYNYRMTNIQAAFGVSQLEQLEDFIEVKRRNYKQYEKLIKDIKGLRLMKFNENTRSNYWFYSIYVEDTFPVTRDELLVKLNNKGIMTRPLWRLIHKQKPYIENQNYKIDMAYDFEKRIINIPCSSNLTQSDLFYVIDVIREIEHECLDN